MTFNKFLETDISERAKICVQLPTEGVAGVVTDDTGVVSFNCYSHNDSVMTFYTLPDMQRAAMLTIQELGQFTVQKGSLLADVDDAVFMSIYNSVKEAANYVAPDNGPIDEPPTEPLINPKTAYGRFVDFIRDRDMSQMFIYICNGNPDDAIMTVSKTHYRIKRSQEGDLFRIYVSVDETDDIILSIAYFNKDALIAKNVEGDSAETSVAWKVLQILGNPAGRDARKEQSNE